MAFIKAAPSFISDDSLDRLDTQFSWKPLLLSPSHPITLHSLQDSDSLSSFRELVPELLAVPPYSTASTGLDFHRGGNGHAMPSNYASGPNTRGTSVVLDTRGWSRYPSFPAPYAPPDSYLALMDVRSYTSLPRLVESCPFYGKLTPDIGPNSQAILHTQPAPDLDSSFSNFVRYQQESVGTNPGYPTLPNNGVLASASASSSSGTTEDHASFFSGETQPPAVLYRPPEWKWSGRRGGQSACAINIEGFWIDKDDLYPVVGQGGNMITVHECQWAKSSNPCGMWIIGSTRAHVGAHIRKWHGRTCAANRTLCLWDGCSSTTMLKDSIGRHVMTVHLGEGFLCQGCDKKFSRKDVYDQHVQKVELCRGAGAAMVYETECRVIDIRKALQQGGTVRYAD